jgi:cytochrome c553
MMNKTYLIAALLALTLIAPATQAGDAAAGEKAFNAKGCVGCHGKSGKAPIAPNYPVLGGKPADFISAELTKFRSGERQEPTMNAMAGMLNETDIDNISAYLAAQ